MGINVDFYLEIVYLTVIERNAMFSFLTNKTYFFEQLYVFMEITNSTWRSFHDDRVVHFSERWFIYEMYPTLQTCCQNTSIYKIKVAIHTNFEIKNTPIYIEKSANRLLTTSQINVTQHCITLHETKYFACYNCDKRGVAPGAATILHGAAGLTNNFHGLSQALPIIHNPARLYCNSERENERELTITHCIRCH